MSNVVEYFHSQLMSKIRLMDEAKRGGIANSWIDMIKILRDVW